MKKSVVAANNDLASPPPDSLVQSAPENCNPDHEEIARLAYSYWEARGGQEGSPEDDWYKAEGELKAHSAAAGK